MNKLRRDSLSPGVEDMQNRDEFKLAKRIFSALAHPDNPSPMFDFEASILARHLSIRLVRMRGASGL